MTYVARGTCGSSSSLRAALICKKMSAHIAESSPSHRLGDNVGENSKLTTTVSTLPIIDGELR